MVGARATDLVVTSCLLVDLPAPWLLRSVGKRKLVSGRVLVRLGKTRIKRNSVGRQTSGAFRLERRVVVLLLLLLLPRRARKGWDRSSVLAKAANITNGL